MNRWMLILLTIGSIWMMTACSKPDQEESEITDSTTTEKPANIPAPSLSQAFKDYWYSGTGELSRYKLSQARYGEVHEGDAVLIFLTEDFLTDQQVKYEYGERAENVQSVMKLNATRKFFTGIYPYSIISSIFTPVNYTQPTLKVSTSTQEWCGHTYSQLNREEGGYKGTLHSYFQAEGDQDFTLGDAMLEDEIWTKVRLHPAGLPTGTISLVPGTQFLRLRHRAFALEAAEASLTEFTDASLSDKALKKYRIVYQQFQRILEITFESEFPHSILAWEEQYPSGFENAALLTTRAVRTHVIQAPYWDKHNVADSSLRKELGLDSAHY